MSENNNFKCVECLKTEPKKCNKPVGDVFYPYKGQNNTELCHSCGGEKCYNCGKNSKSFIHLFEKSSDNSVGGWYVCYCDECFLNKPKKFQDIRQPSKKLENNNSNNS